MASSPTVGVRVLQPNVANLPYHTNPSVAKVGIRLNSDPPAELVPVGPSGPLVAPWPAFLVEPVRTRLARVLSGEETRLLSEGKIVYVATDLPSSVSALVGLGPGDYTFMFERLVGHDVKTVSVAVATQHRDSHGHWQFVCNGHKGNDPFLVAAAAADVCSAGGFRNVTVESLNAEVRDLASEIHEQRNPDADMGGT